MVARFHSRPKSVFYTPCVENGGDLRFAAVFFHERLIDPADVRLFVVGTRDEHDPIGLYALLLAVRQHGFRQSALVHEHPAQSVSRDTILFVTERDQAARALKYFGEKLAAVLAGHRQFDSFDDG